ncbi:MAG: 5-dehydro-4-deoxy-D-glucuronate isomerase [Rhodobacteraceae bacterium]|nr:5-dehydro-4-deoxy-D-glucuronate isomerase [Paracoccaceae bacterium]PHR53597.1 MAG: 5-dehydro-4-deoxy-D-glucuronate isomerase [Robiginitomaculum sp.]
MLTVHTLYAMDPPSAKLLDTSGIRSNFHIGGAFQDGEIRLTYTHYDRMIVGGVVPNGATLVLDEVKECGTASFLDRREVGILNIGDTGSVAAMGQTWQLKKEEVLYLPKGAGPISFAGQGRFYLMSAPAHHAFEAVHLSSADANQVKLGAQETSNDRTIFQFIHPDGVQSCQLVMGLTKLHNGSVWNTMPAHLHDRRMEAYLYYDLSADQRVLHLMGQPEETRHIIMANEDIAISPPWSIHAGAGTGSYTFCWAMAGDNMAFTDMDPVPMDLLK